MQNDIHLTNVINWAITVIGAGLVYFFFQRDSLKVARWKAVSELEADLADLHSMKGAVLECVGGAKTRLEQELRFVLDDESDWEYVDDTTKPLRAGFRPPLTNDQPSGVRYWQVRELDRDGARVTQYVSSPAMHDCLLWFRRADRALQDGVLRHKELADWWRQTIFFGTSGRLEYMQKYFEGSPDIQSIIRVIAVSICELKKRGHSDAIERLRPLFKGTDIDVLRSVRPEGEEAVAVLRNR
jgi:hypothetical protein